jgi:hypothetical protein
MDGNLEKTTQEALLNENGFCEMIIRLKTVVSRTRM